MSDLIDITIHDESKLKNAVQRAREQNIIIPTFKQMINPDLIPDSITKQLDNVGLWDLNPLNLFRINWHNEAKESGGKFGGTNYLVLPKELTGIDARIVILLGKWFPTGSHKVGAAYACLVPRLVTGQFDPTSQKAVWPSTGNYCRGGAYDSNLLACDSIAILPEGMSKERFDWLADVAGETIKTPGSESNVKEIFDKCWELRNSGQALSIFNQFDEFGNYLWHYEVTSRAMMEALSETMGPNDRFRATVSNTGSGGTIACGDYMKEQFPLSKIVASEALQCPTLLNNGFGAHRIEGIGDKHVPWIHNVKNTDVVTAIDDCGPMALIRLFNEPAGQEYLVNQGVSADLVDNLHLLGISSIANVLAAIKTANYYEMDGQDVLITMATDSMEMYQSRLTELTAEEGEFTNVDAAASFHRYMLGETTDNMQELTYVDRKRIHNLKYFTWVEQQGKSHEEIQAQWYNPEYWTSIHHSMDTIDDLIDSFNERTGLLKKLG
ncbi:MAG: pyridoxal-phosphate dependent enzyme [Thermodesulfobacteriota bacterium]|nr:pyridoxal-phosphate dependent enzyme [Thermodesulfobacteriota bacterium]